MAMPTYLKNLITYTQNHIAAVVLVVGVRVAKGEVHAGRAVSNALRRRPEPAISRQAQAGIFHAGFIYTFQF